MKKEYSKPQISKIELIEEEAVVLACKSNQGGGITATKCKVGASPCSAYNT